MARESTQHKLDRVRSPRVHITYDVETGGAIELKELPFVVGVVEILPVNPPSLYPNSKTANLPKSIPITSTRFSKA
jgi:type VI secretion system protein ImpB